MAVKVIEKLVPSSDGVHTLWGRVYVPDGEIVGTFGIVHGMAEHICRYDDFMRYMAGCGYVVFGEDHLGHGKTAKDKSELGYFAKKDGYKYLIDDVHEYAKAIYADYPDKKHIMLGHSMGSFIVRLYAAKYGSELDGLIIMGTGGKNPAAGAGIAIAKLIRTFKGEKHISGFIDKLAFGKYNERTEKETPKDWITHDKEILGKYITDEYSGYDFTVSGMIDLMEVNSRSNKPSWYEAMRKDLPVYVVSGTEDPVGEYGKGPAEVAEGLKTHGCASVILKLWDGMRHEALNETGRAEVYSAIAEWCGKI